MVRLTRTSILASCLFVLVLGGASGADNKSADLGELSLDTVGVGSADVIEAESRSAVEAVSPKRRLEMRRGLMLIGVLLVVFLLWLILFRAIGRRLRKRAFRAHAPTPHADIWASHKPPELPEG